MNHEKYFQNQAIKTANSLAKKIRESNGAQFSPRNGEVLYEMPVYEPLQQGKENLLSFTRNQCNTNVIFVAIKPDYIDAYYRKEKIGSIDEKITIIVGDMNTCWTRFFLSKELMHHYMYSVDNKTSTPDALNDLIMSIINDGGVDLDSPQSTVDIAAYYGAVEYLIPSDTVPILIKIIQELHKNPETKDRAYLSLAMKIRVPESILEFRLRNDSIFKSALDFVG